MPNTEIDPNSDKFALVDPHRLLTRVWSTPKQAFPLILSNGTAPLAGLAPLAHQAQHPGYQTQRFRLAVCSIVIDSVRLEILNIKPIIAENIKY